jgi:uncharacterized protein YodC (DUF2158 family)
VNKKPKNKKPFNIGDKVKLKSGGPKMTVEDIGTSPQDSAPSEDAAIRNGHDPNLKEGEVKCSWFAGYNVKSYVFKIEMVRRIM